MAVLHPNKRSEIVPGQDSFEERVKSPSDDGVEYAKDTHLERLLLRLHDVLFDAALLHTESRDRPSRPYFRE